MVRAARTIAVIGNGIIGHGIAEIFAGAGWRVRLVGRNAGSLSAARRRIGASLKLFVANRLVSESGRKAALARIKTTTKLDDAKDAELVIEAVPEDMALKRAIFGRLDRICAADAILASSSGHLVSELVDEVSRRGRVVATHFWYPPQLIPLVEICAGPETAPDIVPRICTILLSSTRKSPASSATASNSPPCARPGRSTPPASLRPRRSTPSSAIRSAGALALPARSNPPISAGSTRWLPSPVSCSRISTPRLRHRPNSTAWSLPAIAACRVAAASMTGLRVTVPPCSMRARRNSSAGSRQTVQPSGRGRAHVDGSLDILSPQRGEVLRQSLRRAGAAGAEG